MKALDYRFLPAHIPAEPQVSRIRRVLVVEANEDVAEVFKCYLELFELDVVVESDMRVALTRAQDGLFDAYIIDIGEDSLGSIELCRKLRSMPFAKTSAMVATTAYAEHYRKIAIEAGFDAFFVKPVDAEKIVQSLFSKNVE